MIVKQGRNDYVSNSNGVNSNHSRILGISASHEVSNSNGVNSNGVQKYPVVSDGRVSNSNGVNSNFKKDFYKWS